MKMFDKKYLIVLTSACVLEIGSTFYINVVSEKNYLGMIIFAFIGPFLSLPFVGYMVESKNWIERSKLAFFSGVGYMFGSIITIIFFELIK